MPWQPARVERRLLSLSVLRLARLACVRGAFAFRPTEGRTAERIERPTRLGSGRRRRRRHEAEGRRRASPLSYTYTHSLTLSHSLVCASPAAKRPQPFWFCCRGFTWMACMYCFNACTTTEARERGEHNIVSELDYRDNVEYVIGRNDRAPHSHNVAAIFDSCNCKCWIASEGVVKGISMSASPRAHSFVRPHCLSVFRVRARAAARSFLIVETKYNYERSSHRARDVLSRLICVGG